MGRLLAVVAALAGACLLGAEAFIPALPAGGKAVQSQQARPLAAPLQMAKHPQFKIIKKKMHKRPKKSRPSDRNRGGPSQHAVDQRDMSGPGWLFPEDEGWVPYDAAVHGPLDAEIMERVKDLNPIWVRIIDPKTGAPALPLADA